MSDVPRNRQQERSERSTRALLDAAAELIVEGGFDSLTFATIGERAGYSRGLVTARFGSKDGLIEALIERIVGTWNHRNVLPQTKGRAGLEGLSILLDAIRAQAERDPTGLQVLYALSFEAVGGEQELRARFAKLHETMRTDFLTILRRGKRDGSIDPSINARREAVLIMAGLRGVAFQWMLDPDAVDPVDALAYLHDTTVARLSADGAG
ncbi:MAG: TetR/AcrR family transcriptional regulator [Actinomycetota bacterium]